MFCAQTAKGRTRADTPVAGGVIATSDDGRHRPVLVVGAGPAGLTAALALRAQGLPVTVLEAQAADRQRPGSRAIYTHGVTLRLLERLQPGLGWRIARQGVVWPTRRTLWRGREVFARSYPPGPEDRLPPFTSLPQTQVEDELLTACKEADVEFVWQAQVDSVDSDRHGVRLVTAAGEKWTSEYVVGADGARSGVRRGIHVGLDATQSSNSFVIVDVAEDPRAPQPAQRVFHYHHPQVQGRHVLLVPFAGGWRADLQCRPDEPPEWLAQRPGLDNWLAAVLGDRYVSRVTWVSTYRFKQGVADAFTDRHGRVLLAGEAAHLFPPFGARGMNSGMADADAAARAIAAATAARSRDEAARAVARFDTDRRAAAERNSHAAGKALAHLQARRPPGKVTQRLAAAVAPRVTSAGRWLDTAPYGPRGRPRRRRRGGAAAPY